MHGPVGLVGIHAPVDRAGIAEGVFRVIRGHPLLAFFGIAYASSWLILLLLYGLLRLPAGIAILVQTIGPTFAALVVTLALEGRGGPHRLLQRVRIWRVDHRWYVVALLGVPVVSLAAALALPGALASFSGQPPVALLVQYVAFLFIGALSGPLFEEPGWRGFALPHLQARMGPLRGTLLLGGLWGAWHLPQFLVPDWADGVGGPDLASVVAFLLLVLALAPLMTWVFNHTRGSLFLAMVVHSSFNASQTVLVGQLVPVAANAAVSALLGFGLLAVLLVVVTRGRLGYQGPSARGR